MPSKEQLAQNLFESYFNIRKDWWSLVDTETNQLNIPDEGTKEYSKLKDCMDVLADIDSAKNNGDWLKIIYKLHDIELKEQAQHDERWLLTRMIVNTPLLMDVMRAIREVIVNDGDVEYRISSTRDSLNEKQKEIEVDITRLEKHSERHSQEEIDKRKADLAAVNKKLDAIDGSKGYRDSFFEVIKSKDPKSKDLGEDSFKDFSNNIEVRQRKATLTKRLQAEFSTISGSKSALQSHSTFKAPANDNTTSTTSTRSHGYNTRAARRRRNR